MIEFAAKISQNFDSSAKIHQRKKRRLRSTKV
jgi:hypothetical protein